MLLPLLLIAILTTQARKKKPAKQPKSPFAKFAKYTSKNTGKDVSKEGTQSTSDIVARHTI